MAQLVVRDIADEVKAKLQKRAKRNRRSMEEEVRAILRDATKNEGRPREGLGTRIANRFRGIGLKAGEEIHELHGYALEPPNFRE